MFQTVKKHLENLGVWVDSAKLPIKRLLKDFTIIPKTSLDPVDQVMENMSFGFFWQALKPDEIIIYLELWRWGLADWVKRTDDDMGPFEFIVLDVQIYQYIKMRRMANEELEIDITVDSPGFMAEALYAKTGALRERVWPKVSTRSVGSKPVEIEDDGEKEITEVQMYRVGDDELTEEEYKIWHDDLPPDKKVAMLGHVTPFIKKIECGGNQDE